MEISAMSDYSYDSIYTMQQQRTSKFNEDDVNQDGYLDASELGQLQEITGLSVDELLSTADSDGDGLLTEEEISTQLRPDGPPPPPPSNALGGRLDSETVTQLLDALQSYAEENEDTYGEETSLEQLISDFIEDITVSNDTSTLRTGLLVNTSA